jgi:hypothetical protein
MKRFSHERVWLTLVVALPLSGIAQGILPTNFQCESKFNPISLTETSPRLSWQVVAGRNYIIETTTNLASGYWTPEANFVAAATFTSFTTNSMATTSSWDIWRTLCACDGPTH